jgi:hypothetical protein
MFDILGIIQPMGIVLGLLGIYFALSQGMDIFSAVFRGVVIYGVFMILGLIVNFFYTLMVQKALEVEKKKLELKMLEVKEEIKKKAEERKAAIVAQNRSETS